MSEAIEAVVVPSEAIQKVDNVSMAIDRAPQTVLSEAHQAAKALQDVVSKKARKVMFNGEQYLEFEDLQTLGRFYGVTAGQEGDSEFCNIGGADGAKAKAVAMRGGQIISRATAYCMRDEPNWKVKPWFQLASMAQTRANAKVLRNVLAWVVVLAGYKATPAEEMDGLASVSPAATHATAATSRVQPPQQPQTPTQPAAPSSDDEPPFFDDDPPLAFQEPSRTAAKESGAPLITEPQAKRFFAIAKTAGWTNDEIKSYLKKSYGIDHSREIKKADYDEIIAHVQSGGSH